MRLFLKACDVPWAILPASLQMILDIATRENLPDFEAVEAKRAKRLESADNARIRENGTAVINIIGPIFRRADMFTEMSGATSVDSMARDFTSALNDRDVQAIVLNIDSPGGEVAGVAEFAQMIFDARGKKPIIAYGDSLVASAAYWIASAADEIVADSTAMIGSIGVVAAVPNPAAKSAREIKFISSQSPHKQPDPTTESGKGQLQGLVDSLADVFVSTVARNRGASVETVLSDFGQGGIFVGEKSVSAGLADRLGSFESLISELSAGTWTRPAKRRKKAAIAAEDETMTIEEMKKKVMTAIGVQDGQTPTADQQAEADKLMSASTATPEPTTAADDGSAAMQFELENARAENARLREVTETARAERISTEAKTFADYQVGKGRAFPAQRATLVALYTQASRDDFASPLQAGSRVADLEKLMEATPSHSLTSEQTVGGDDGDKVLEADGNGQTEMSDKRRRELLEATPVGRAALRSVK